MIRLLLWFLMLPLQLLLFALFLFSEAVRLPWLLFRRGRTQKDCKESTGLCTIVVLNWNGRHLLEESLPPLVEAVLQSGKPHQILLVDNGSSDDSVEWVRTNFPSIDTLALGENLGFAVGNNRGVEAARNEIVVLLNNDMIVEKFFLEPLIAGFSDPEVFAVTSQIFFPEGRRREETGNTARRFERGYLHMSHEPIGRHHLSRRYLPVLWAGGGSSAFHRSRFIALGGFSHLYSPCYLEDADLSYRAWRRGWKILLATESRVLHKHRSSSSVRFSDRELHGLVEERRLWYIWSNFQLRTLFRHLILLPLSLTKWLPTGVYFRALRRLPWALGIRILEPARQKSDAAIDRWIKHPVTYLNDCYPDRSKSTRKPTDPLRILIVSAYLPHLGTHGGAGRVFQLLKESSKHHDMSLITFVEDQRELSFVEQARKYCRRLEIVIRRDFQPLSYFPYEPFEEFNSPQFRKALEELIAEEDFDLVHFEWTQMALYADLFPHIPKIVTEVEVNYAAHRTLVDIEKNLLQKIHKYYNTLQTLYREVEQCQKVDRIVCVTEEDKRYLQGYLPEHTLRVINTGVDTTYFHYNMGGSTPGAIVFVGAFRHAPNVDAMQYFCREVFPAILEGNSKSHLYIVGSSPPPEIKNLSSEHITVTGFVEDIRDYYRIAQVVVVPLRTGVGIRGKILEGWSAGRATVATPLACQGLHAVHGENIIIADNADDFAEWTLALLAQPRFCNQLGRRGRETVEKHYDWYTLGQQMIELYEEVSPVVDKTSPRGSQAVNPILSRTEELVQGR